MIKSKGIFIIGGKRTPFCKHGGPLRELPASHAFAAAAKEVIKTTNVDPKTIDNTIVANVNFLSQCDGGKTPRYCGTYSGVPLDKPALGVNKACASGIQAVITAGVDILTGSAKISLTGGTEIMSALPHVVRNVRFGTTLGGHYQFEDYLKKEIVDSYCGKSIPKIAEDLANKYEVKRKEVDDFVWRSHLRFKTAQDANIFKDEIVSLKTMVNKKEVLVDKDIQPHEVESEEILFNEPPALDDGIVITRLNTFTAADGAAAIVLGEEESIKQQNLTPLARLSGWACIGVNPEEFGLGALEAIRKILEQHKLKAEDVDLYEINETFPSQVLIAMNELKLDPERVNVNGGAIPMGHPAGATGARMVVHLAHLLRQRNLKRGIATAVGGGGHGVAVLIENI